MAGTKKTKKDAGIKRPLIDTVKAIIVYSCRISVGKHGIPLIDRADWNDCLRVDPDSISGADKIEKYKEQPQGQRCCSYGEILSSQSTLSR